MRNNNRVFRSNWWMFLLRFSTFFALLAVTAIAYGLFIGAKYLAEMEVSFFFFLPYIAGGILIFGVFVTLKNFIRPLA